MPQNIDMTPKADKPPSSELTAAAGQAAQKSAWPDAIALWTSCFDDHDEQAKPQWYAGLANAHLALDQFDQAQQVFQSGMSRFPHFAGGAAGLARVAMRRGDWDTALECWDQCLERFAKQAQPNWLVGRAECLTQLNRYPEAEAAIEDALDQNPDLLSAMALYARIAQRQSNWDAASNRWEQYFAKLDQTPGEKIRAAFLVEHATALYATDRGCAAEAIVKRAVELPDANTPSFRRAYVGMMTRARRMDALQADYETGFLAKAGPHVSDLVTARALVTCNRTEAARAMLKTAFPVLTDIRALKQCLPIIALAFEGDDKKALYRAVVDQLDMILQDNTDLASLTLRADAALGCGDTGLLNIAVSDLAVFDATAAIPYQELLRRVENPDDPELRRGKVFGIGLSKTGTTSLTAALGILDYRVAHWANPHTHELICDRDLILFDALTDTPISYRFEQLYEAFPDAQFIHTSRPLAEWRRSFEKHMARDLGVVDFAAFTQMVNGPDPVRYGDIYREIHNNLYCDHGGSEEAYLAHDERVRSFFDNRPADRFLEFNVFEGDGFEKLCAFLGCPVPSEPFPWGNAAASKIGVVYPKGT